MKTKLILTLLLSTVATAPAYQHLWTGVASPMNCSLGGQTNSHHFYRVVSP